MRHSLWQAKEYEQIRKQLEECMLLLKACGVDSTAKEMVNIFIAIAEEGRRHHSRLAELLEELSQLRS
jgi:3-deoxy-D-arabino-heptulosonate 7-phosphate (DAHP) synthase class II